MGEKVSFEWLPGFYCKVQVDGATVARAHALDESGTWGSAGEHPVVHVDEEAAVRTMRATYLALVLRG